MKYLLALVAAMKVLWLGKRIQGDFSITKVETTFDSTFVYLPVNEDTASLTELSLFWNSRKGHAIVRRTPTQETADLIRFEVLRNLGEPLRQTDGAWLSGWLGDKPEDFGFNSHQCFTTLPNGTKALISEKESTAWVIHIHGRKASYAEPLRNARQFDELGFSQLSISHLSDGPPNGFGIRRSTLGAKEWTQVSEAVEFVKAKGAQKVILFAWSLGGMMVNQYLSNADVPDEVKAIILDSPLLDYRSTLRVQALRAGYPEIAGDQVADVITNSRVLRALGFQSVAIDEISALNKSLRVQLPTLLFYSLNDGYISMNGVFKYQELNGKVSLVDIPGARHCRLFNEDKQKYQDSIARFVKENL